MPRRLRGDAIDEAEQRIGFGDKGLDPGAEITLDSNSGAIYAGPLRTIRQVPRELLDRLDQLHGRKGRE